jgi:hypothetical protein
MMNGGGFTAAMSRDESRKACLKVRIAGFLGNYPFTTMYLSTTAVSAQLWCYDEWERGLDMSKTCMSDDAIALAIFGEKGFKSGKWAYSQECFVAIGSHV